MNLLQEKKHIKEEDRLKKDMMTKLESVASEFRKAANAQMSATTQRSSSSHVFTIPESTTILHKFFFVSFMTSNHQFIFTNPYLFTFLFSAASKRANCSAIFVMNDQSIASTKTKYIKLNTKTQNIFCRLNENMTTFLYTLNKGDKKTRGEKKVYSIKVYTKVECY